MTPSVSIIVCTYNRAELLPGCLESLADQTADEALYEVIVVNNNSADVTGDATEEIAEAFAARQPNFRVVVESAQGLSRARNRGWKEAVGEYVAYIDDDARAREDWVERCHEFVGGHPQADAVGGPYDAFFTAPPPAWFEAQWGAWDLGERQRPLDAGEWLTGTNMVWRRDLLRDLGGFDPELGMNGTRTAYGEEVHLLRSAIARGARAYYDPSLRVTHHVDPRRYRLRWHLADAYRHGLTFDRLGLQQPERPWANARTFVRELRGAITSALRSDDRLWKNRVRDAFRPVAFRAGLLVGALRADPAGHRSREHSGRPRDR